MPLAKKCVIAKPVRTLAVAIRNTPAPAYASGGSLSFCGERKGGKNAAKTKVLESFPWAECCLHRFPSAVRMGVSKFHSLLSHCLCVCSRWPLTRARAALAQQGCPLRLSRSV